MSRLHFALTSFKCEFEAIQAHRFYGHAFFRGAKLKEKAAAEALERQYRSPVSERTVLEKPLERNDLAPSFIREEETRAAIRVRVKQLVGGGFLSNLI